MGNTTKIEDENVCESCGYPAKDLREYPASFAVMDRAKTHKFCHICASTYLSHHITYRSLYGENHHLFASLGWIANMLRDEIRSLKKKV